MAKIKKIEDVIKYAFGEVIVLDRKALKNKTLVVGVNAGVDINKIAQDFADGISGKDTTVIVVPSEQLYSIFELSEVDLVALEVLLNHVVAARKKLTGEE